MKRGPVIRKEKLDVLIPAVPKDLATLPLVIDSVRSQVRHPIGNIHVVAPNDSGIKAMCKKKGAIFVDERTVLPFSANRFRYRAGGLELSGWLIQQMIKLNGDTLCKTGHFLVIDADTVLIRPHDFIRGGKTVFYCRLWSRPDYFRTLRRLLGRKRASSQSFVAHYMVFNRRKLVRLKREIETRHGMRWFDAIWHCMDKTKPYAFSEYETYGNFLYATQPGSIVRLPARNKSMHIPVRRLSDKAIRQYARSYRSLSFHQRKSRRSKGGQPG